MAVNADKPHMWKEDSKKSMDFYNEWFMNFAPKTFRDTRTKTTEYVISALKSTAYLTELDYKVLLENPSVLSMLRMTTAPPIARDRLIGLADVKANLVKSMEDEEKPRIPPRMSMQAATKQLAQIAKVILKLTDTDLFTWLETNLPPEDTDIKRAASVVADRLTGARSDPIIRNAQEQRQLASIKRWLENRDYHFVAPGAGIDHLTIQPGSFAFHINVPANLGNDNEVDISVDVMVMPKHEPPGSFPLLIEAKSAGDLANVNKRRKEEAQKFSQLTNTYGNSTRYILFLCGYFDAGYLGYEASEGIDWVWEHRIDDLAGFDL
ncbi:MAG: XamI family restriction endonuclease [Anaerolineae bacterium]|nr:XamI family restriction endonuclease [Anaerolineae bacterium]